MTRRRCTLLFGCTCAALCSVAQQCRAAPLIEQSGRICQSLLEMSFATAVPCTAIGCNKHCQKCWKSRQFVQAYGERLATSRRQEIDASFVPVVQAAGLAVHATVNTIPGHRSAANIAESLLVTAHDVGADIMVVCSHGGCAAFARASCRKCECCWLPALPHLLA
jgi:hypothetical protein